MSTIEGKRAGAAGEVLADVMTTEPYLGVRQDVHDARCDYLKLDLSSAE
jgi:hypothetical protein